MLYSASSLVSNPLFTQTPYIFYSALSLVTVKLFTPRESDLHPLLQGECSEEHVCLPLFAFASKEDADKLETIADEVLGTEDESPPSRYFISEKPSLRSWLWCPYMVFV